MRSRAYALEIAAVMLSAACASPSPTVRIQVAPDGQAVVGVTRVSFTADSDLPSGEAAYRWTFGDGATSTGPAVSHVFATEGTFPVAVTASAGDRQAQATVNVTVRSLAGSWSRPDGGPAGFGFVFSLVQHGSELAADINSPSLCPSAGPLPFGTIRGQVADPRVVTWVLTCAGTREFTGTVASDLDSITGRYASETTPVTYTRGR